MLAEAYHEKEKIYIAIVIGFMLVCLCLIPIGEAHIRQARRLNELSEMDLYTVYSSYIASREVYYVYEMCNPAHTLLDIMDRKFTEDYFIALKSEIDLASTPSAPTNVYMMMPSDDRPYGWEKDELNIKANFDSSISIRHAVCIVTIPYGAESFADCSIKYK